MVADERLREARAPLDRRRATGPWCTATCGASARGVGAPRRRGPTGGARPSDEASEAPAGRAGRGRDPRAGARAPPRGPPRARSSTASRFWSSLAFPDAWALDQHGVLHRSRAGPPALGGHARPGSSPALDGSSSTVLERRPPALRPSPRSRTSITAIAATSTTETTSSGDRGSRAMNPSTSSIGRLEGLAEPADQVEPDERAGDVRDEERRPRSCRPRRRTGRCTLFGAMKTSGYAALPNHRSTWRSIWPKVLVRALHPRDGGVAVPVAEQEEQRVGQQEPQRARRRSS